MTKRELSSTFRLSEEEKRELSRISFELGMSETEIFRACIAIGLPVLEKVKFTRRLLLEDNENFKKGQ